MRRGLGFHNRRSPGVFSPLSLFAGGVNGAWYDPSDATTLFTTSAGTTPCAEPGAGALVVVGRMLDKSGNGNHANAADNMATRPELSARVNLLTYTEQFDNGFWSKVNLNTTGTPAWVDVAIAPDGTTTADKLIPNTSSVSHALVKGNFTGATSLTYTASIYAKDGGYRYVGLSDAITGQAVYDLQTGAIISQDPGITASPAVNVGNGWWRLQISFVASSTRGLGVYVWDNATKTTFAGNGTDGILVWGADLRPANIGANVPAYQRVADQYTYDTVGFPRYLRFDGVDDAMSTPANVNLSGTDKVTVFAGVRKFNTTLGVIAELSPFVNSNNGSFLLGASVIGANDYGYYERGTALAGNVTAANYPPPITNVLTAVGSIPDDTATLRVNAVQASTGAADQGTGNFGTYPLFIGARNKASLFFNGYLYSLIVAGSAVSAGQISSTEQWIAGKEGIVI